EEARPRQLLLHRVADIGPDRRAAAVADQPAEARAAEIAADAGAVEAGVAEGAHLVRRGPADNRRRHLEIIGDGTRDAGRTARGAIDAGHEARVFVHFADHAQNGTFGRV